MNHPRSDNPLVSVVLPVFNEETAIATLLGQLDEAFASVPCRAIFVFVDDGSTDGSPGVLAHLAASRTDIRVVTLSRNFGHQSAVLAGLAHASGDAVVVMDTDLQDIPAAIPAFLERWRQGVDVVYAIRQVRKENIVKRALFFLFYRLLNAVSGTHIPLDAGNFGLIDMRVARALANLPERDRYYAGLRSWVGFRQEGLPVERGSRYDRTPRVSLLGLFRLAKAAIFSFSTFPLTVFYVLAFLSLSVTSGLILFTLYHRLFTGLAIPGWTSTVLTSSFFGGLNALGIAVLGEFVVRIYDQVRARPPYVVCRVANPAEEHATGSEPISRPPGGPSSR